MENLPTAVVQLALSVACVVAGGAWLLLLRSKATSWRDALHQRQIQGFSGLLLVGMGLVAAVGAAVSLIPALAPYRDVIMFVMTPIGLLALGMVLRKLLPVDGEAAAR
ncbi:MAG TPA: hypothetical protein VES19_09470 [Candidatus Limnocylindrales bacterium]|nr:hypothetical protein [Candidatus Limnocylindrales bacterium]